MPRAVLILALLISPTDPLPSLSVCYCRVCSVPLPGDPDHAAAQHVLYGSSPGEGGVRDVLPGGSAVPQLLLAFPHCLLSLREGLADFLKVSQHECGRVVPWEVLGSCSTSTPCSQMFYPWGKGASTQSSVELRGTTGGFWGSCLSTLNVQGQGPQVCDKDPENLQLPREQGPGSQLNDLCVPKGTGSVPLVAEN